MSDLKGTAEKQPSFYCIDYNLRLYFVQFLGKHMNLLVDVGTCVVVRGEFLMLGPHLV